MVDFEAHMKAAKRPEPETPVTSPTGGTKNRKLARFDLMPTMPLKKLAEQYGRGAAKYGDRNWEKGYPWSLSYAAAMRHLNAFWGGEDWDPEFPDAHHLDAAMFHLMSLRDFAQNHRMYDDRPRTLAERARRQTEGLERQSVVAQETAGDGGSHRPAEAEQAAEGRNSTVQASRWEVP